MSRKRIWIPVVAVAAAAFVTAPMWSTEIATDATVLRQPSDSEQSPTAGRGAREVEPSVAQRSVMRSGVYGAPVGARFVYRLAGATQYELSGGGADRPTDTRVRHEGRLIVTVIGRDAEHVHCRVRLAELRLEVPGGVERHSDPQLAAHLSAAERAFDVRLEHDGRMVAFRFAPSLDGDQRNFVRGLVLPFCFVVRDETAWEVEQSDTTGRFLARYERKRPSRVERSKIRYVRTAAGRARPRVEGTGVADLSPELGWLAAARVEEKLAFREDSLKLDIAMKLTAELRLVASDRRARHAVAADEPELESAPWLPAAGHGEELGALAAASERARVRRSLAHVTLPDLLRELTRALAGDDPGPQYAAWTRLTQLLEVKPELVVEARDLVARREARGHVAAAILTALGASGSGAAQRALVALEHSAHLPAALRETARQAMVQLERPQAGLLDSLQARLAGTGPWSVDDQHRLLVFGAIAPRGERVDALLGLESRAARERVLPTWLDSLGNAAVPAVFPALRRYATSETADVRAAARAALEALAKRGHAPARELLARLGS